jgi:hypothetical protein
MTVTIPGTVNIVTVPQGTNTIHIEIVNQNGPLPVAQCKLTPVLFTIGAAVYQQLPAAVASWGSARNRDRANWQARRGDLVGSAIRQRRAAARRRLCQDRLCGSVEFRHSSGNRPRRGGFLGSRLIRTVIGWVRSDRSNGSVKPFWALNGATRG